MVSILLIAGNLKNNDILIPKILLFVCILQNDVLNYNHKSTES